MAGIYIHIPFCKQRCHYCDFYSTTDTNQVDNYVEAMLKELRLRKNYISEKFIETIYFGGGTPSVLSSSQITKITDAISELFTISESPEITLEVNPDDITCEYVKNLKTTSVNRISMGIQSFNDDALKLMNRRHNADEAVKSVKLLQNSGFNNISIDLIYGLPNMSIKEWKTNIKNALNLNIQHISAYHLTYEEGTVFWRRLKKGELKEVPDNDSHNQYKVLTQELKKAGFEHYEISNFSLPELISKHNSSYWKNIEYLGLGTSAHSYNKKTRSWNKPDLKNYISKLNNDELFLDEETLSESDKYNEYIMTSLRTIWGVDLNYLKNEFGIFRHKNFISKASKLVPKMDINKNSVNIKEEFLIVSDSIIQEFFID